MEGKTIVIYFSAEGTTARLAKFMAQALNVDLFEIKPVNKYTSEDLNWMNKKSRSSLEMNDETSRPEILEDIDLSSYDNIIIGFPIWWYIEPRIVDSFLDKHDLLGKKMIPFATSGGSSIENAYTRLSKLYPEANWQKGKVLNTRNVEVWLENL